MSIQNLKSIAFLMGVAIGTVGFAGSAAAVRVCWYEDRPVYEHCRDLSSNECSTHTRHVRVCADVNTNAPNSAARRPPGVRDGGLWVTPPERAPSGGLLEATPGLSPQGPARTGSPRGGTIY
jgi:hypothetical protein